MTLIHTEKRRCAALVSLVQRRALQLGKVASLLREKFNPNSKDLNILVIDSRIVSSEAFKMHIKNGTDV